jgi:DNA polymerase-3 subunit chi
VTRIDFYVHVENTLHTLCALAAKALGKNMRMMILTPDAQTTERVDKMLWSQPAIGFLPHCRAQHRLAPVTPLIVDHLGEPIVHEQILVNLCSECPPLFSRFDRVIEIVGLGEVERDLGRTRFRFYRDRGYDIRTHDLAS